MDFFDSSKWIWPTQDARADEYAEFYEQIDFFGRGAELHVCADSNYTVYVNGCLAAFGQYPDFPHSKVYDTVDISRYMRQGRNVIAFRVWYYGIDDSSTYYPGTAGLLYALYADGVLAAYSSRHTPSRLSPAFMQHKCKRITVQLGLSFEYDANRADAWMLGEADGQYPFSESAEVDISPRLRKRSCRMTEFGKTYVGREVSGNGAEPCSLIFDFGKEAVGFICLKFVAHSSSAVTVAFGEHLKDGRVRREIGGRDFSFIYHPVRGEINYYTNSFRRFGCRYVELITEGGLSDVEVSMRSVEYPVEQLEPPSSLTPTERRIYAACVHTLKCCMHEHYEDCPWREQALYTMDSRNQMLAGYYAFGEKLFPKANLELIAEDARPDGLLSICYPMKRDLAIPSFSLHFITECEEYLRYSGDEELIRHIYPKIKATLDVFLARIDDSGLVRPFRGANMWNFYEWEPGLDGAGAESSDYDLALNALLSFCISRMMEINRRLGLGSDELSLTRDSLNEAVNTHFYRADKGLYETRKGSSHFAKLTNALAILSGAADTDVARGICESLTAVSELTDASLSMRAFLYDALLLVDRERYAAYVLSDIERIYSPMTECGNGTVWETERGESDFDNAGSLCHGWSSIPIYYYNLLKDN